MKTITIRTKLTIWYVTFLAIVLITFTVVLYFSFSTNLRRTIDKNLEFIASQLIINIDYDDNKLAFQNTENGANLIKNFIGKELFARILDENGNVIDGFGNYFLLPADPKILKKGFLTILTDSGEWRVYTVKLSLGWLQVAEFTEPFGETLEKFRSLLVIFIPLTLIIASIGSYLLAKKTLKPIDRITNLAREINAEKIDRRLDIDLPDDELGRLSKTFNQMLDRLENALNSQKQFSANAAHDLRTPLTSIKGIIDVTLNRERDALEYKDSLIQIRKQVERMSKLVDTLLIVARFDSKAIKLHKEKIDLTELLEVVVEQMQYAANRKGIILKADLQDNLTIVGDFDLVVRLFLNLIDNAIKYNQPGGQVTVTAKLSEEKKGLKHVLVSICDTGQGIPENELERIFDKFYRIDKSRSRVEGAGLGLSIVKEIALAHNAEIQVKSQLGKGSIFIVKFPI